ncbi:MAG: alcohol dehydrogenase catalytic domain-containing protein [candidate division NC10 bacterium]|nr:alcohol dehydrogenase catalytic domain-containing protein [candidate division NC10 bacterium]
MAIPRTMLAAVYVGEGRVEARSLPVPAIGPGELLVALRSCGLCGSDIYKIVHGTVPPPVVLGHEIVGTVVAAGGGVRDFSPGSRVVVAHHVPCGTCHYCRHGNVSMCADFRASNLDPGGFAPYIRVPARHVAAVTFPVPEALPDDEAAFTEPLASCLRAVKRSTLQAGEAAVVVGLGSIGLLFVQLLHLRGARLVGVDPLPGRRDLARRLGAEAVADPGAAEADGAVRGLSEGRGADLVVLTAGSAAALPPALGWVRDGGALCCFAPLAPDAPVPLNLNPLYYRELTLFGSYSPSPDDLREALDLLAGGGVRVAELITHRLPLSALGEGVAAVREQRALKVILRPDAEDA